MNITFYDYVTKKETFNTNLFKKTFNDTTLLPQKVCSSTKIWNILKNDTDIDTNIVKAMIFKNCFMEYFTWKITNLGDSPIR